MDLRPTEEQTLLVTSFTDLFAKYASSERVRAAESTGHDGELWDALVEVGAVAMAVPAAAGGWDASLVDLALVAEVFGRNVAPAPLIEAQVSTRLLAGVDDADAEAALADCLEGDAIATLALHPTARPLAPLVPAGSVAHHVVGVSEAGLWLLDTRRTEPAFVANLGSQPLADVPLDDATTVASGRAATALHSAAVDEWLTLTAAALVGVAARAHEMAVEYAKERTAFGARIGTFQGVSHPLAEGAMRLDGARLLARKAAWAHAEDPDRFPELAAMAFAFASETARDVTYDALHTHGGYGFMLEHDVQLHHRRARGWARVFGDPRVAHRRAAAARYAEELS